MRLQSHRWGSYFINEYGFFLFLFLLLELYIQILYRCRILHICFCNLLCKLEIAPFLFFLWLPDPDMAISRVQMRVRQGGHNVPSDIIIRRYYAGLKNLYKLYRPVIDVLRIYNASLLTPRAVAHEEDGRTMIFEPDIYNSISREDQNE